MTSRTKDLRAILREELTGWKRWELVWMLTACLTIILLSIYWKDSWMGILSATTGIACVVCTGKGKLSAYFFGLINSVLYAVISYKAALYGETMLNALYYVPMQFIGFYTWSRHINRETHEVEKRRMKWSGRLLAAGCVLLGTLGYGMVLEKLGDAMPYIDAFTTVTSVAAMILSVKMFAEQWWIWVAVDVFSVYMWWNDFRSGSDNMATLLMWAVYLINAVIMLVKWEREAENEGHGI